MDGSLDLRIRRQLRAVTVQDIASCSSLPQALARCAEFSGLQDKSVAIETGIDNGLWSRIKSGDAGTKWDFEDRLMDACGNELPLLWRVHSRGWDIGAMRRRESDLERENRELREQLEAERNKLAIVAEFMGRAKTA